MDTGNALCVDIATDQGRSFFIDAGGDLLIAHFCIGCLLGNPGRIQVQNLCQLGGDCRNIRFGLLQLVGIQVHILHALAAGQNIHIPVVNKSTVCCHLGGAGLIPQRQAGIIIIVPDHQIKKLRRHRNKCQYAQ